MKHHQRFRDRLAERLRRLSSGERRMSPRAKQAMLACEQRVSRPLDLQRARFLTVIIVEMKRQNGRGQS